MKADLVFFFFQAEDGIRDLVRSRGLGDVYKRQERVEDRSGQFAQEDRFSKPGEAFSAVDQGAGRTGPVSYTHLTLPTSDLV